MTLMDRIIGLFAPYECLSCSEEGQLMCHRCISGLPSATAYTLPLVNLSGVQAATVYSSAAKELVWRLKSSGARAAARAMAIKMAFLLPNTPLLIVPVPTTTSRVRQRGYDQAGLIARELSRFSGWPLVHCLARHGHTHQVGSNQEQRQRQLKDAFRVTKPSLVRNMHIVLVDDVVTTGSTLEAAAKTLIESGAANVEALTFARPKFNQGVRGGDT